MTTREATTGPRAHDRWQERPTPLQSLRSLTTHEIRATESKYEQGEVRAHQAARQHRHDGSHRPWQDDADGCDLQDVGGEGVGEVHAVRSDRQGAGGEGSWHHD